MTCEIPEGARICIKCKESIMHKPRCLMCGREHPTEPVPETTEEDVAPKEVKVEKPVTKVPLVK